MDNHLKNFMKAMVILGYTLLAFFVLYSF
ncbi:DUF5388 domain-containing protein [Tetragenococcus koreensis]|nr:DUF5388 domain-containing protein [Tetragenococcus koreensis]